MAEYLLRLRNGGPYEFIGRSAFGGAFVVTGYQGAERFPDRDAAIDFAMEKNVRNVELVTLTTEEIHRAA